MCALLVVALVAWRWIVLGAHGEPVGVDFGNWLSFRWFAFGPHVSGGDVVYPPVVPFVVTVVSAVFGVPTAAHLLAAAAALAPGMGVWFVLHDEVATPLAIVASLITVVGGATSAASAWGGLPQLFGLGLAPIVVLGAARLPARPSRREALTPGVGLTLVGATSPLVFGLTGAAAVVAVLLATTMRRDAAWLRSSAWVLLPVLLVVPLYATYLSRASLDDSIRVPGEAGARSLSTVFVSAPVGWAALSLLALAAPVVLWRRRREPLWAASTALSIVTAVAVVTDVAPRWACLAPTAASVGAAVLCGWSTPTVRHAAIATMALGAVVVAVAAPAAMFEQRDLYARFVPRGTGTAVAWLDAHTAPDTRVAVASVDGAPFGWLVEGWARRPALVASDPTWLYFPGERAAAATATSVFTARHWPSERTFASARHAHVALLYVPSSWHGVDPQALRRACDKHRGLVAYQGDGALILRVPQAEHA